MNDNPEEKSNSLVQVKVSRFAIISMGLAITGPILLIICLFMDTPLEFSGNTVFEALSVFSFGISGTAIIIGIVSFVRIEASGGKISGRKFSIGAVLLPIFAVFLIIQRILQVRIFKFTFFTDFKFYNKGKISR